MHISDTTSAVRFTRRAPITFLLVLAQFLFFAFPVAAAQEKASKAPEVTGELGSPSATTTIDGRELPAPPPEFGGVIKPNAADSKPWWPPRIVPPKDAPNVLLIITDDSGFGVPSTFGGVIPTPALDRVANEGLRYNNIHSTA